MGSSLGSIFGYALEGYTKAVKEHEEKIRKEEDRLLNRDIKMFGYDRAQRLDERAEEEYKHKLKRRPKKEEYEDIIRQQTVDRGEAALKLAPLQRQKAQIAIKRGKLGLTGDDLRNQQARYKVESFAAKAKDLRLQGKARDIINNLELGNDAKVTQLLRELREKDGMEDDIVTMKLDKTDNVIMLTNSKGEVTPMPKSYLEVIAGGQWGKKPTWKESKTPGQYYRTGPGGKLETRTIPGAKKAGKDGAVQKKYQAYIDYHYNKTKKETGTGVTLDMTDVAQMFRAKPHATILQVTEHFQDEENRKARAAKKAGKKFKKKTFKELYREAEAFLTKVPSQTSKIKSDKYKSVKKKIAIEKGIKEARPSKEAKLPKGKYNKTYYKDLLVNAYNKKHEKAGKKMRFVDITDTKVIYEYYSPKRGKWIQTEFNRE